MVSLIKYSLIYLPPAPPHLPSALPNTSADISRIISRKSVNQHECLYSHLPILLYLSYNNFSFKLNSGHAVPLITGFTIPQSLNPTFMFIHLRHNRRTLPTHLVDTFPRLAIIFVARFICNGSLPPFLPTWPYDNCSRYHLSHMLFR